MNKCIIKKHPFFELAMIAHANAFRGNTNVCVVLNSADRIRISFFLGHLQNFVVYYRLSCGSGPKESPCRVRCSLYEQRP